jgi:hypothetical protein
MRGDRGGGRDRARLRRPVRVGSNDVARAMRMSGDGRRVRARVGTRTGPGRVGRRGRVGVGDPDLDKTILRRRRTCGAHGEDKAK